MTDKERLSQVEMLLADFAKKQDRMLHVLNLAVATLAHHSTQVEFLLIKLSELSEDLDLTRKRVDMIESKVDSLDMKVSSLDTKVSSLDTKVDSLDMKMDSILALLRDKLK